MGDRGGSRWGRRFFRGSCISRYRRCWRGRGARGGGRKPLGLVHLTFSRSEHHALGRRGRSRPTRPFSSATSPIFLGLLTIVGAVFVCGGCAPRPFVRAPCPVLRAYTADLTGSLLGGRGVSRARRVGSTAGPGPSGWALGRAAVRVARAARDGQLAWADRDRAASGHFSAGDGFFSRPTIASCSWPGSALPAARKVNRDFHQYLHDVFRWAARGPRAQRPTIARCCANVRRSFTICRSQLNDQRRHGRSSWGAGTGNDVAGRRCARATGR